MKVYCYLLSALLITACGGSEETSTANTPNNDDLIDDEISLPDIPSDCLISANAASEDGEHVASNVLDDNISTRWSAEGSGQQLIIDLCEYTTMTGVDLAFYSGDSRTSSFSIDVSNDNNFWVEALTTTTSSGSSDEIESYSFDTITARYIRFTGYGNSSNAWNSVTEFFPVVCSDDNCEIVNLPIDTNPEDTTPVDYSDPNNCHESGLIAYNGSCEEWSEVYEAEHGILGEEDHITSLAPLEMTFNALNAQHVTPNGNGWRHELKIKLDGGYRVGMTEVYELFKATIRADLTPGSKTIVAQHHAATTATITKLYIADLDETGFSKAPDVSSSNSKSMDGIFDVYIRLAKPDGSGETKHLLTTIQSGESFDFEEENDHGVVTVSINGQSLSPITVNDSSASYFKFGNYLQAQNPETGDKLASGDGDGDWADFYAEYFTTSDITFTNMSYIRIVD